MTSVTQLLSVTHAAEVLDCSPGHVYNLIALGKIRAVEIKATGKRPKTRIRDEDLEAFIQANTRGAKLPADRVVRRPEVWAGMAPTPARGVYTTTQAARHAEVLVGTITAALRTGRLHGTRSSKRGRWRIDAECLTAWTQDQPCPHRPPNGGGAGEVRRVDGT